MQSGSRSGVLMAEHLNDTFIRKGCLGPGPINNRSDFGLWAGFLL